MKRKSPRRQHDGPTLADVARHAGVSPMTVSRVINGEVNVRENTRELVNKAIQALGYSPNQAARSWPVQTRSALASCTVTPVPPTSVHFC